MNPYAISVVRRIGEIEIMVASKEEAPAAAKKIDDIAKELGKVEILVEIVSLLTTVSVSSFRVFLIFHKLPYLIVQFFLIFLGFCFCISFFICHLRFPFSFQHFHAGQSRASLRDRRVNVISKSSPLTSLLTYFTKLCSALTTITINFVLFSGLDPKIPDGKVRSYLRHMNRPVYEVLVECFGL